MTFRMVILSLSEAPKLPGARRRPGGAAPSLGVSWRKGAPVDGPPIYGNGLAGVSSTRVRTDWPRPRRRRRGSYARLATFERERALGRPSQ
jgi:hypothetical protein